MEKYKEKIRLAEEQRELEERKKAEEALQEQAKRDAEAARKKDHKAQLNATKKQRKVLRQLAKCNKKQLCFYSIFYYSSRLLGRRREQSGNDGKRRVFMCSIYIRSPSKFE